MMLRRLLLCSTLAAIPCIPQAAGLMTQQSECAAAAKRLFDVAVCLRKAVDRDPDLSGKWWARSYAGRAEALGKDVDAGRLSDREARRLLDEFYTELVVKDRQGQEVTRQEPRPIMEVIRERERNEALIADILRAATPRPAPPEPQIIYVPVPAAPQRPPSYTCTRILNTVQCDPS